MFFEGLHEWYVHVHVCELELYMCIFKISLLSFLLSETMLTVYPKLVRFVILLLLQPSKCWDYVL